MRQELDLALPSLRDSETDHKKRQKTPSPLTCYLGGQDAHDKEPGAYLARLALGRRKHVVGIFH